MRRIIHAKLLASALAIGVVPFVFTALPASAQAYGDIGLDYFHDALQQYGYWGYSDRWGLVWQPSQVDYDFRPYYTAGHWVYTDDYGWYWASDYPWGDIAFHYGRWVNDPDSGWLWIPGYTWSPGWVVWRSNGQYIGWMPAPPDRAFLQGDGDVRFGLSFGFGGGGVSFDYDNDPYYGYRGWYGAGFDARGFAANWVFVGAGHMADANYVSVSVRDPIRIEAIIRQTHNVTHYTVVNNYVVNKSIDVHVVERAAGHPIRITPSRAVIRQPNLVMRADAGQRIQMRERMIAPHGNGFAGSAPPPPPSVVNKLSTNVPPRGGAGAAHLFSKATIATPETQSRFHGAPVSRPPEGGPGGMGGPGRMTGPGGMSGPGMTGPGMTGPGGLPPAETRHREQPPLGSDQGGMSGPGSMNGPGDMNAPANPPATESRHRTPPSNAPEGMSGPGGMSGPDTPPGEPHRRVPPTATPDGMSGPGPASPPAGETGHRMQGPPSNPPPPKSAPAGQEPPANPGAPPTERKKHKPDQPPPGTPQ